MAETDLIPFTVWSITTIVIVAVTGISYRIFSRRKRDENPSP